MNGSHRSKQTSRFQTGLETVAPVGEITRLVPVEVEAYAGHRVPKTDDPGCPEVRKDVKYPNITAETAATI
jgi:hypothetical protein